MKHKHHLYPRYMAKEGNYPSWADPELVVEVSYSQHIMFHWCNYRLWGNPEDELAYRLLAGQTENKFKEIAKLAGHKRGTLLNRRRKEDKEFRERLKRSRQRGAEKNRERIKRLLSSDPEYRRWYKERQSDGGRRGGRLAQQSLREKRRTDPEYVAKMREVAKRNGKNNVHMCHNAVREKRKDSNYDSEYRKKQGDRSRGKKWINKDAQTLKVLPENLPEYLSKGWVLGRKPIQN
jgi:hypothetical protein